MPRIAQEIAEDADIEFAGAILRPHSDLMTEEKEKAVEVMNALRKASYMLINNG